MLFMPLVAARAAFERERARPLRARALMLRFIYARVVATYYYSVDIFTPMLPPFC